MTLRTLEANQKAALSSQEGLVVLGHPDVPGSPGWGGVFAKPREVWRALHLGEVGPALDCAQQAADDGAWVVFALAYEAAPGLDPCLETRQPGDIPLVWAAAYDDPPAPLGLEGLPQAGNWNLGEWTSPDEDAYRRNVAFIQAQLRAGESYQVNYTTTLEASFDGDPLGLYLTMGPRMAGGYSAYLHMGEHQVASFSPELFFHRDGDFVTTRPMKGTAPRGRFPAEDHVRREALAADPKERAENVMIVDLLRNDLGRLAVPGSVAVPRLFDVEAYPTVLQMTSTVTARLKPGTGLRQLLTALFPCGSVTGAPKIRTMQLIAGLEAGLRQIYCGAIGCLSPHGKAVASVPIRTLLLGGGRARFGVGSGITVDSEAGAEYRECRAKMRFLTEERPAFRLLESLLLKDGEYFLLEEHLRRLRESAAYFGFGLDEAAVAEALEKVARKHPSDRFKVRLLCGQGGAVEVEALPLSAHPQKPVRLALARGAVHSQDVFLFYKTTRRQMYDAALAAHPEAGDVLLTNERDEVTETCRANLVYRLEDRLYTPPQTCGLLDGVLRRRLLDKGVLTERTLPVDELPACQKLWLINSVRKWMRVENPEALARAR